MAPKFQMSVGKDMNVFNEHHGDDHQNHKQIRDIILLNRKINNSISDHKWKQRAVCREREAMIRQQYAKARGEAAICRILQSKAIQHKERAIELDILADLLSVRVSELLDQCSTSTGDLYLLQFDALKCSIDSLSSRSRQHLFIYQTILLESKERQTKEELRQKLVSVSVRDFESSDQCSGYRNLTSGVNKLFRTALANRMEHNALLQEAWAHLQEAQAEAHEEHVGEMLLEKETFWNMQKEYIL